MANESAKGGSVLDTFEPEVRSRFKYWQMRTIFATMIGYALFYFVRKNFSMAMPGIEAELGVSKTSLGLFLTLNGVIYGVSRFCNGFFADRLNGRYYMAIGLALSAIANFAFGYGPLIAAFFTDAFSGESFTATLILFFGITWTLNAILQGSGFPPCARLLTHWIPPNELATKMSVWNTSHSIGASIVVILCGYIISAGGDTNFAKLQVVPGEGDAVAVSLQSVGEDGKDAWKELTLTDGAYTVQEAKTTVASTPDETAEGKRNVQMTCKFPANGQRYTARISYVPPKVEEVVKKEVEQEFEEGRREEVEEVAVVNKANRLSQVVTPETAEDGTCTYTWKALPSVSEYNIDIIRCTGTWKWCFWIPAGIAFLGALFLLITLRDTPTSVGLPELPGTEVTVAEKDAAAVAAAADAAADAAAEAKTAAADVTADVAAAAKTPEELKAEYKQLIWEKVFGNHLIWILAIANFFVYVVRLGVLDWGPTMLKESKHLSLEHAGWLLAVFEICGILGMLFSGWATDKWLGGRAHRTCVFCMLGTAIFMFLFWCLPPSAPPVLMFICLGITGFFIYGPQALIGIAAANQATKKAAATANGLTGIFGYASGIVSGIGMGWVVQHYGWDRAYIGMIAFAIVCIGIFMLMWNAKADGYDSPEDAKN